MDGFVVDELSIMDLYLILFSYQTKLGIKFQILGSTCFLAANHAFTTKLYQK